MPSDVCRKRLPVTGVILAGGKSRRMGANKALMPLGNDSLIGHVIRRMRRITDDLLLITNTSTEYAHLGLPMYADIVPDSGALGGIYTGLTQAASDVVICVACDSPFLEPRLLKYLASVLGEHDAVMPYTYSGADNTQVTLQTLCAVYAKRCLPILASMLEEDELRVHALAERVDVHRISSDIWRQLDPDGMSFFNINTPEALARADSYLKSQLAPSTFA